MVILVIDEDRILALERKRKPPVSIMAGFPDTASLSAKQYFQSALFHPRNRIAHWGYVNASKAEAEQCHTLAIAIVSILREMDRLKYGNP